MERVAQLASERERLNDPAIVEIPPRRGGVAIQTQKSKSNSKSHFSISMTDTQNIKIYESDEDKSEEYSTKHYRTPKGQTINIIGLKNDKNRYISDTDEIGGGAAINYTEMNKNIICNEYATETDSETEYSDSSSNSDKGNHNHKHKRITDFRMNYTTFHWLFVILFTAVTVVDRFTVNLWPLWVDSPGPTIPNNLSVSMFALIAWISGRMMLVSSSYLFFFQNHVFWNWFVETEWIHKYIIIGDIRHENNVLHYHIGWLLCGLPVLLHVWSIVFAGVAPQNSMKLYSEWMRPNDEFGNSIPFYANNLLSLGINDVYRLVSTSVAFLILIPYSVIHVCRNQNWSFAQWLHLFGAMLYTVDLIRMKSHPHCWVFNVPFILWWICDRMYGIFYYRRSVANIVKKLHLDNNYMVLYLRIPLYLYNKRSIGDVLYFNQLKCTWDRAHPFTVFWNHKNAQKMVVNHKEQLRPNWNGHKFQIYCHEQSSQSRSQYIMSRKSTELEVSKIMSFDRLFNGDDDHNLSSDGIPFECDWNVGIIVQIVADHTCKKTWTNAVFKYDIRYLCGLRAFGPYRSEYRLLQKKQSKSKKYPKFPLVLIGTGAGCAMLLDFYNYIQNEEIKLHKSVIFYFSTRSIAMFQWFTDLTCLENINNLYINAHLTSHANITKSEKKYLKLKSRDSNIGRLNINEILNESTNKSTNVYFCGSPNVQMMVGCLCKRLSLTFHAGHSF